MNSIVPLQFCSAPPLSKALFHSSSNLFLIHIFPNHNNFYRFRQLPPKILLVPQAPLFLQIHILLQSMLKNIQFCLFIYFVHSIYIYIYIYIYIFIPISQLISPHTPLVSIHWFSMFVSLFLLCKY